MQDGVLGWCPADRSGGKEPLLKRAGKVRYRRRSGRAGELVGASLDDPSRTGSVHRSIRLFGISGAAVASPRDQRLK
jgi:hypothetical protein